MEKMNRLTFYKANFKKYRFILEDDDIRKKVSAFLLRYVSIESFYKKLLIEYKEKDGKKLSEQDKNNLRVIISEIKKTLSFFDVKYDDALVERIFGSSNQSYQGCSIKKLRDRLVHNVNENALCAVLERYDSINSDLDSFLKLFFT